jgi:hypothetical protein
MELLSLSFSYPPKRHARFSFGVKLNLTIFLLDLEILSPLHFLVTKNSKEETHGKMNDFVNLECEMILGNDVIFDTPKKQTESSQYQTPERNYQEISQLKETFRFLSPATKIKKANRI